MTGMITEQRWLANADRDTCIMERVQKVTGIMTNVEDTGRENADEINRTTLLSRVADLKVFYLLG